MRSIAAVALVFALVLPLTAHAGTPRVGKPAPDFEVETFDHQRMRLSDFKGQVVILNFWATWCAPCRRELPLLDVYYRERRENGLRVLAIATEDSVPDAKLKPLASVLSFPMVRHLRGPYGIIVGLPTSYVIDRAGVVRYAKAGAFDLDSLNALLVPLLNEPAPEAATVAAAAPGRKD